MAVDQDALDHFGPLIIALEARIAVLEAAAANTSWWPDRYTVTFEDGSEKVYEKV